MYSDSIHFSLNKNLPVYFPLLSLQTAPRDQPYPADTDPRHSCSSPVTESMITSNLLRAKGLQIDKCRLFRYKLLLLPHMLVNTLWEHRGEYP
jgi:hypothetical protein